MLPYTCTAVIVADEGCHYYTLVVQPRNFVTRARIPRKRSNEFRMPSHAMVLSNIATVSEPILQSVLRAYEHVSQCSRQRANIWFAAVYSCGYRTPMGMQWRTGPEKALQLRVNL